MTAEEIAVFLEGPHTGVLTTLGPDGYPHTVAMWFVAVGDELRMWAYARSQKIRNLERDPRCAVMVEEGSSYSTLRGILVRGDARLVDNVEEVHDIGARLYQRYTLPATGIPASQGPDVEIRRQAAKRKGVVLAMDRMASWDHSKLG